MRKRYLVKVQDLLEKKIITINDEIFHILYKPEDKEKKVVAKLLDNGKIRINESGKTFNSLSSAAQYYTKIPINGWKWWYFLDKKGNVISLHELRLKYFE